MPTDQPNTATDLPGEPRENAAAADAIDTGASAGDAGASAEAKVLETENEAEAHPS